MDIVEKILRQHELSIFNPEQMAIFDLPDEDFVTWKEAANEIERLRGVLQQIADIEHEDIPVPQTSNEGVTWTVLAMAVGLAEKALKEGE